MQSLTPITVLPLVLLLLLLLAGLSIVLFSLLNGISPMPSTAKACGAVLSLASQLPRPRLVLDLGSGWGAQSFALARQFPDAAIIGFETSPVPWLVSACACRACGLRNVRFLLRDFRHAELGDADLVVCYLYTGAMTRLAPRLRAELKPGAAVISNTFALPQWTADRVVELDDIYLTKVYRYRVPAPPVSR